MSEQLPGCTNLRALSMKRTNLSPALARSLKLCPSLKCLSFEKNEIDRDTVFSLSECFVNLTEFWCSDNSLEAEKMRVLCSGLKHASKLDLLNLHNNHIDDEGANHLADALPHLKSLRTLQLGGNKITSTKSLASALSTCPKMRTLDISFNRLDDASIRRLMDVFTSSSAFRRMTLRQKQYPAYWFKNTVAYLPLSEDVNCIMPITLRKYWKYALGRRLFF